MDRKECYDYIKANNLKEEIANVFGKNFTNVSTQSLEDFIAKKAVKKVEKKTEKLPKKTVCETSTMVKLIGVLVKNRVISKEDADYILEYN